MAGPYFKWQEPAVCGCYYPDVVRIQDNRIKETRTLLCLVHGKFAVPLKGYIGVIDGTEKIPSEEWREAERKRLRGIK